MTRILLIEDDPGILESLQRGLSYKGYAIDAAPRASTGLALAKDRKPDLVVLDLMLPDLDGVEVCRQLKQCGDPAVIMLTARDQLSDRVTGLDAGADDYVVKPFAFDELLARIRAVLRRRQAPSKEPETLDIGDLHLDFAARTVRRGERTVSLTPKEFELLEYLARNAGQVLRKSTIQERVWGFNYAGESDPVKVFINHLREKLNASGEPDLIGTVRGFGYMLRKPRES